MIPTRILLAVGKLLLLSLCLLPGVELSAASAQTPQEQTPAPAFEVASIRAVEPGAMARFPEFPSSQFVAENLSAKIYIAVAYGMSDDRILGAPAWVDEAEYTVRAKPEGDKPLTEEQYQPLLKKLLAERFHLSAHFETREVSGYELVVDKSGPKMQKAEPADAMAYILSNGLESTSITTETIASLLGRPLGKPVVDSTGLKGSFKLSLHFAPQSGATSDLPDIFTAVQEQLGLKLIPKKVPTKFLVIDHIEKPASVD